MRTLSHTLILFVAIHSPLFAESIQTDACVYGGTSGGVVAAVQAARMDKQVVAECENLFATFALSAGHTAFASIRMEPVFLVTSQSAATAACVAIDDAVPVQEVDYEKLRERLLANGQVLQWPLAGAGVNKDLAGIVLDDTAAKYIGAWSSSNRQAARVALSPLAKKTLPTKGGGMMTNGLMQWDGRPSTDGKLLALSRRPDRQVALFDISDLEKPKPIREYSLRGHAGACRFWNGQLVIPAGYQGLLVERRP